MWVDPSPSRREQPLPGWRRGVASGQPLARKVPYRVMSFSPKVYPEGDRCAIYKAACWGRRTVENSLGASRETSGERRPISHGAAAGTFRNVSTWRHRRRAAPRPPHSRRRGGVASVTGHAAPPHMHRRRSHSRTVRPPLTGSAALLAQSQRGPLFPRFGGDLLRSSSSSRCWSRWATCRSSRDPRT